MTNKVEVTRIFKAPIHEVWKVWTDSELVKRWWGPRSFTSPTAKMDFREGGKSIVSMKAPMEMGGQEYFSSWVYTNIIPMKTIEFIQSLLDKDGKRINPTDVGMPSDFPLETKTVVTFEKISVDQTKMTVVENANFGSISEFAQRGLEESIDKMEKIFDKSKRSEIR